MKGQHHPHAYHLSPQPPAKAAPATNTNSGQDVLGLPSLPPPFGAVSFIIVNGVGAIGEPSGGHMQALMYMH